MKKTLGIILLVILLPILLRVNGSKGSTATVETVSCQSETGTICRAKVIGGNGGTLLWEDRNGLIIRTRDVARVGQGQVYLIEVKPPTPGNGDIHEIVRIDLLPRMTLICTEKVQPSWKEIKAGTLGVELNYIGIPTSVRLQHRPNYNHGDPTYLLIKEDTEVTHITPEEVTLMGGRLTCPSIQELHTSSW